MSQYIQGRAVKVEIGLTEGAAKTVSAVTQADPGVATCSVAHTLLNGSVGYFTEVEGMTPLEGQAVRLSAVAGAAFTLEGIDTEDMPGFTGTAGFVPITAWATVSPSTSYSISAAASDKIDTTVLLDDQKQEENGLLAAQSVTINVNSEKAPGQAMALIEKAARKQLDLVWRITFKTGEQRIWRGQPDLPGEDVQQGQKGTGSFNVTVRGQILKLGAVA
jgi:hypothetical protein